MHIETPSERPPELVASLVDVWERSVRATHDFLAEEDIAGLRPEVGLGVAGVAVLAVAVADAPDDAGRPFPPAAHAPDKEPLMTTSKDYLSYVLDLLSDVSDVTYRAMMGEYLLYAQDRLFGGIYDERLLVKDVPAARAAQLSEAIPYEGAKPMLLVESENPAEVAALVAALLPELPAPKPRKKKARPKQ